MEKEKTDEAEMHAETHGDWLVVTRKKKIPTRPKVGIKKGNNMVMGNKQAGRKTHLNQIGSATGQDTKGREQGRVSSLNDHMNQNLSKSSEQRNNGLLRKSEGMRKGILVIMEMCKLR